MPDFAEPISIALETTCRLGAVALGVGDELVEVLAFDAARRAATQVVTRLDELVKRHGLAPTDIQQVYVSAGPGSFTGTRVGVTVARMLVASIPGARCVAVPTVSAVAAGVENLERVEHLAVILDARQGEAYAAPFDRRGDRLLPSATPRLAPAAEVLEGVPRPLHLAGEGLGYHDLSGTEGDDLTILPEAYWLPRVEMVWQLGRREAAEGRFTPDRDIRCIYTGEPAACRAASGRHVNRK